MKFLKYDTVIVLKDLNRSGIFKGEIGTVVEIYENPHEAYEVEFLFSNGDTKSFLTLLPDDLEKVN